MGINYSKCYNGVIMVLGFADDIILPWKLMQIMIACSARLRQPLQTVQNQQHNIIESDPPLHLWSTRIPGPQGPGHWAESESRFRGRVRVGTALGHRGTARQSLAQSKSSAHESDRDPPLLIGQRLRISLISTQSPQPIHQVIAVGRLWGRACAGVQLESQAGLTKLANFCQLS
jgi:hypothetical protein